MWFLCQHWLHKYQAKVGKSHLSTLLTCKTDENPQTRKAAQSETHTRSSTVRKYDYVVNIVQRSLAETKKVYSAHAATKYKYSIRHHHLNMFRRKVCAFLARASTWTKNRVCSQEHLPPLCTCHTCCSRSCRVVHHWTEIQGLTFKPPQPSQSNAVVSAAPRLTLLSSTGLCSSATQTAPVLPAPLTPCVALMTSSTSHRATLAAQTSPKTPTTPTGFRSAPSLAFSAWLWQIESHRIFGFFRCINTVWPYHEMICERIWCRVILWDVGSKKKHLAVLLHSCLLLTFSSVL